MTPPIICAADVGSFWLGPDGDVWRIVGFCEFPTVTFEKVADPGQRRGGAVGSLITDGFSRLVVEKRD